MPILTAGRVVIRPLHATKNRFHVCSCSLERHFCVILLKIHNDWIFIAIIKTGLARVVALIFYCYSGWKWQRRNCKKNMK